MTKRPTPRRRASAPEVQAEIGRRITTLREATGLTKLEFAARHDLDRNYLGRVERGEQNLELATIIRLSLALGENDLDALVAALPINADSLKPSGQD